MLTQAISAAQGGTMRASAAERQMRALVEKWGRRRWPGCRVVNELVIGDCRIDMAFIAEHRLAGVEIKSENDEITRVGKQHQVFTRHIPEVWFALAPNIADRLRERNVDGSDYLWSGLNRMIVDRDTVTVMGAGGATRDRVDWTAAAASLHILWRDELVSMCRRYRVMSPGSKTAMGQMLPLLARRLTGDEIIAGVCHELRRREAKWVADPPCVDSPCTPLL